MAKSEGAERMQYRSLNIDATISTIVRLESRIKERFPESGLLSVCGELLAVAHEARHKCEWIARPNWWLRGGVGFVVLAIVLALVVTVSEFDVQWQHLKFFDLVQIMEAGINDIVLVGAAAFFLITIESRIKRARALAAIHELRAIAHVIDMHQLTKDPAWLLVEGAETASSPKRIRNEFELSRYLDYCSEMLALNGKLAAYYAQSFSDAVILAAVSELESLGNALSRKIWQKIMLLHGDAFGRRAK